MFYYFDYEEPVFRPPSEARSLIFQITVGCSQNQCTFCGMYKHKSFRIRPVEEIVAEMEEVPRHHRAWVQRVFLADGDALIYPQNELLEILRQLQGYFPQLNRVGAYASPNSLRSKSVSELELLKQEKLRILYFGLESGDGPTLQQVDKGFTPEQMLALCQRAKQAGLKLSVTAILGLAGKARSKEHAQATAAWINALSPEYFSLLTLFVRHNDDFLRSIQPLTHGGILQETVELLQHLNPYKTIFRSNHISNALALAGSYPKDREKLLNEARAALVAGRNNMAWFNSLPAYREDLF